MTQITNKINPLIKAEREAYRVCNMKVPRGTARAKRRAAGNYTPVNIEASLAQAPNSRYSRSDMAARKAKAEADRQAAELVADAEASGVVVPIVKAKKPRAKKTEKLAA